MLVLFCACLVCFLLSAPVALAAAEVSVLPGALLGVAMTAGVFFAVYGRRVRQRLRALRAGTCHAPRA